MSSVFHRVVVGVCPSCGYANFAGCSKHNQLLSANDGPSHYGCAVSGCTTSTMDGGYQCDLCRSVALDWLPVVLTLDEVRYALDAFSKHPRTRQTQQLAHGLIVCALCSSTNFPGHNGVLTECRGGRLYSKDHAELPVSNWALAHVHTSDCEGKGNEFALTLHPVLLTMAEMQYLSRGIVGTGPGTWNDAPSVQRAGDSLQASVDNALATLALTSRLANSSSVSSSSSYMSPPPVPAPPLPYRVSSSKGKARASTSSISDLPPTYDSVAKSRMSVAGECTVCFEEKDLAVFYKCGHLVACLDCAASLRDGRKGCPVCRAVITDVVRVYIS